MNRLGSLMLGCLGAAMLLAACSQDREAATVSALSARGEEPVIVVLTTRPSPARAAERRADAAAVARAYGLQPTRAYGAALVGFAANAPAGRVAALQRDPRVAYVEPDRPAEAYAQVVPTGIERTFASTNSAIGINGVDDYRVDVDVAVIDTGIDLQHPELNVVGSIDCSGGSPFKGSCKAGGDDDNGHGTHVAGIIGAIDNGSGVVGMAPGARLWAVKVLNSQGSGWSSWIVAGIDWVTEHAGDIEVANMSLGGSGFSQAEYDAIQAAVEAGVAFAVAAGNEDDNAANYSPSGFDNVLTVSALADFDGSPGGLGSPTCRVDQDDTLAIFSNWGSAVDVAAPGVCITSTLPVEQGGYGTMSGTSMASPHAAGALALLASKNNPNDETDVFGLYSAVESAGNDGWTDDSGDGIKEPLLDVSSSNPTLIAGGGTVTNQPPTARFTFACQDLTCTFDGSSSSDPDGSVAGFAWTFGDGGTATGATPSHTYGSAGTYTATLTVTDDADATDSVSHDVTVSSTPPGTLDVTRIEMTTEHKGRNYDAVARVFVNAGTTVTGAFAFDGEPLNTVTSAVSGDYAQLTSSKTKTTGTFTIAIQDATGVTACSIATSEASATCTGP